jgi:hypothetical protein
MPVILGGPEKQQNTSRRLVISDHETVLNTADCELYELTTILEKAHFKDITGAAVNVNNFLLGHNEDMARNVMIIMCDHIDDLSDRCRTIRIDANQHQV